LLPSRRQIYQWRLPLLHCRQEFFAYGTSETALAAPDYTAWAFSATRPKEYEGEKAEDGIRTRDPHLGKVMFYH
jgi:hypothetical protein